VVTGHHFTGQTSFLDDSCNNRTTGDSIDIHIARTRPDHLPFISSLEIMPLDKKMNDEMNRNYTWFLIYRSHFGGTDIIG